MDRMPSVAAGDVAPGEGREIPGPESLLDHPAFPRAAGALARNMLVLSENSPKLEGIFKDAGRYVAAMCAAALQPHFTLPELKALCARFGILSPGRTRAILIYLRYLGYASLWSERSKSGPARYLTSPEFLSAWQEHLCAALNAARLIDPIAEEAAECLDEPSFLAAFCRIQMDGLAAMIVHAPSLTPFERTFMSRHAGNQIVWALLDQPDDGEFPPQAGSDLSSAALSRRFRVSRIHVNRMLDGAVREGLMVRNADGVLIFTIEARVQIRLLYAVQLYRLVEASRTAIGLQARS
jgi:hypothetical protein